MAAAGRTDVPPSVGWLIGVARHKLVDHWRRQARQQRLLQAVEGSSANSDDPWDVELDRLYAHEVLARLARGEEVDAGEYTFRTTTQIETATPELDWLNKGVFIGVGARRPAGVIYETYLVG